MFTICKQKKINERSNIYNTSNNSNKCGRGVLLKWSWKAWAAAGRYGLRTRALGRRGEGLPAGSDIPWVREEGHLR